MKLTLKDAAPCPFCHAAVTDPGDYVGRINPWEERAGSLKLVKHPTNRYVTCLKCDASGPHGAPNIPSAIGNWNLAKR